MQTIQYRKSTRNWEMKEVKFKKPCQESGLWDIPYARYSKKRLPKFINLCMESPC